LYSDETESREKAFLCRCLGIVMKNSTSRSLVSAQLSTVDQVVTSASQLYSEAGAEAFGIAAVAHLGLVLDKLEALLRDRYQKRSGSFFGLIKDAKAESERAHARGFILRCVGQAALKAPKEGLADKADTVTVKFVAPALKSASVAVKVSSLGAAADVARAVRLAGSQGMPGLEDLVREAIECLTCDTWTLEERTAALKSLLELIRCPPRLSQMTRCSLLRACFAAAMPAAAAKYSSHASLTRSDAPLREFAEGLRELTEEVVRQDAQPSTLDEIFTLLEPWMARDYSLAREIACLALSSCLTVYLDAVRLDGTGPSEFTPGPFVAASLVPRCFDDSRHVQSGACVCLQALVKILQIGRAACRERG